MKNRLLGLGIFAIVFSLTLFFFGTTGLTQASEEPSFSQLPTDQQHCLYDSGEINQLEGILQQKNEISEQQHPVRRFPASLSAIFLLLNEAAVVSSENFLITDLSTLLSKDISLAFHNLRI